jgi:hypothetical protein
MWFRPVNETIELVTGMSAPQFRDEFRECEDQSWIKVQAVPVFRSEWCKMFSHTAGVTRTPSSRLLIYEQAIFSPRLPYSAFAKPNFLHKILCSLDGPGMWCYVGHPADSYQLLEGTAASICRMERQAKLERSFTWHCLRPTSEQVLFRIFEINARTFALGWISYYEDWSRMLHRNDSYHLLHSIVLLPRGQ